MLHSISIQFLYIMQQILHDNSTTVKHSNIYKELQS